MKKFLLMLVVMMIIVSCSYIETPIASEVPTLIPLNTESPTHIQPTNTLTLPTIASTPTSTETPPPLLNSIVQMKYPNHESCKIQIDTQKWEITDEWRKSIVSASVLVPISFKYGMGGAVFIKHKNYTGCEMLWATAAGYEGMDIQESTETINGKSWEVWAINELMYKIYFWTDLKEIHFDQKSPLDVSQKDSCQADVYEVLGSLQCN